jgi:predicted MFS family arabinose efflux permease
MSQKSISRTFVLVKVLQDVGSAWTFSTYVLFLVGSGLTLFKVNMLNLIFMSTSTILDPFTGNWGDRIGQKKIYMAGLLFWGIGMLIYGSSSWFWFFAVAEATAAVGQAFMSEALESWLRNHTDEEVTHQALSTAAYWAKLATIPTAVLGGLVGAKYGLRIPWFLSGITSLVVLGISWWQLRKFPEKAETSEPTEASLNLWTIAKNAWKEPVLKRSFIAVALITATFQPFNMFWSVIFKEASGSSEWLGFLWMGIALTSALGSFLAKKWQISSKGLALIIAAIGLPMLLPLLAGNWVLFILVPFLFHEIWRSTWAPVLFSYTNRKIENGVRTSVNSLRSSAGTLGAAVGLLVSGILTKWLPPIVVWGISAAVLLEVALWVRRWNHD